METLSCPLPLGTKAQARCLVKSNSAELFSLFLVPLHFISLPPSLFSLWFLLYYYLYFFFLFSLCVFSSHRYPFGKLNSLLCCSTFVHACYSFFYIFFCLPQWRTLAASVQLPVTFIFKRAYSLFSCTYCGYNCILYPQNIACIPVRLEVHHSHRAPSGWITTLCCRKHLWI